MGQFQDNNQMKNIFLLSIVGLALLLPAVEAFFLGPIAVGAIIWAIAVGKGFILGSILSQKRSRKQTYRKRRSYTPYKKQHHYSPKPSYYKHYTKQTSYYCSSNQYSYRGKRFAPEITM